MTESSDLLMLRDKLRTFAEARDWDQFHSPKNLNMALMVEVAELMEHFQWLTEEQSGNLPLDKKPLSPRNSQTFCCISFASLTNSKST